MMRLMYVFLAFALFLLSANSAFSAPEMHYMQWKGVKRSYELFVPANGRRMPLLVLLHGGNKTGQVVLRQSSLPFVAIRERFVIVAPDAIRQWNNGRTLMEDDGPPSTEDDIGFIMALIARLKSGGLVDGKKVFVAGISNGALMTLRLACERPDVFVTATVVAATMLDSQTKTCSKTPIPIQFFVGTEDQTMVWQGGTVSKGKKTDLMLSGEQTLQWWAQHNQCKEPPEKVNMEDINSKDDSTVTRINYNECASRGAVEFFQVNGGGHTWPQVAHEGKYKVKFKDISLAGNTNQDVDAGEAIWEFYKKQYQAVNNEQSVHP